MTAVQANGIAIEYAETGPRDAPVILLIMGLGMQLVAWLESFCDGLSARGFRIVRFDNRDALGRLARDDGDDGARLSFPNVRGAVGGVDDPALQSALEKLADADLLFVEGAGPQTTYRFKHALIQDAAYESLLKSRRQALHRRAAEIVSGMRHGGRPSWLRRSDAARPRLG